jgi:6-phosphogluconolactonase (cycloisomerase 2 family)
MLLVLGLLSVTGRAAADQAVGAVYTATNDAAGNAVVAFDRDAHGLLAPAGAFPTGGRGTGAGLGNQGALRLTRDGRFVIVINAGSNDVSVLEVDGSTLVWRDRKPSGGVRPVSLAVDGRLVYVLNAGGSAGDVDSLVGFRLSREGALTQIPGSTRRLSAPSTGPAQVEFSADGSTLVVTEKATSLIDVFSVASDGTLSAGVAYSSSGTTPFGFAFGQRDQLFVSEAFGGAVDGSAVSSYRLTRSGELAIVSPSVATTETAACWIVVTNDGRFVYTTNAGSGSISAFRIDADGAIALADADGVTAQAGAGPTDMALSGNSQFLYALHAGSGSISLFRIVEQGGLESLGVMPLARGANGLAAR